MNPLYKDPINLVISGVGGQGNVMISLVVGSALVNEGFFVTVGETYGASQRGGSVMSHVKISLEKQYSPLIPAGRADIILGMEPVETLRMLKQFGNKHVTTIVNPRPIHSIDLSGRGYPDLQKVMDRVKHLSNMMWEVNATEEAQKIGNPILANMILIGALVKTSLLPIGEDAVRKVIVDMFPKTVLVNEKALKMGINLTQKQAWSQIGIDG
jgi:indolepyruvate ferredoxin oxidoreductase, beta subunit